MEAKQQILEAALRLAPRERADLIDALAASLDGIELGEEWEGEIRGRIEDIDSNSVQPVPGEEVFQRLEKRLRAR